MQGKIEDFESLPENTLGQRVTKLRKLNNMNKKELATKCKISPDTISNIEKERITTPNISTVNQLSKALRTTNKFLLQLDKYPVKTHGQTILKHRLLKGLTQRELGRICNLNDSTIKDYENDSIHNPETLKLIYKNLNIKRLSRI